MTLKTPLVPFQSGSPIIISGPTGSGKLIGLISYYPMKCLQNMFRQFYIVMEFIKVTLIR